MKLNVHVLDKHVGVLEQVGDFRSVMAYIPDTAPENLVSLTMPVRTESYPWDDELHPIFRMNLPEGYLLQVLQEEFGPHIGASPVALLSVIGRNMVGRLKVAPPGAVLDEPAKPVEVAELLKGDNSEEAFSQLVREHARSGVSGVLPKFLDAEKQKETGLGRHSKVSRRILRGVERSWLSTSWPHRLPQGIQLETPLLQLSTRAGVSAAKGRPPLPKQPLADVVDMPYSGNALHPTQKPVVALAPLVRSFTLPGELVLDPFAGSGSFCAAALLTGRRYFGIELDSEYFDQATARLRRVQERIAAKRRSTQLLIPTTR